jgi:hypothetical protein
MPFNDAIKGIAHLAGEIICDGWLCGFERGVQIEVHLSSPFTSVIAVISLFHKRKHTTSTKTPKKKNNFTSPVSLSILYSLCP